MSKQERVFSISGDNKGLVCPFKPIVCQEATARNVKYTLIGRGRTVVVWEGGNVKYTR